MKRQFTKFAIVGGINTAITLVMYWGLLLVLDPNWSYGLSFVAGVFISWFLNSKKTFETELKPSKLPIYGAFYLFSYWVGQLVLNFSIEELGINEYVAIFGTILASLPINFLGSRFILTRGAEQKDVMLDEADIERLADLHLQCLPTSITARLGRGVTESFYRYVMDSPLEVLEVQRDENNVIIGSAFVSEDPEGLNGRLKFDLEFLFYIGLNFYRVPLSTFLNGGEDNKKSYCPELVYLFTDQNSRSNGLGTSLLGSLEEKLKKRDISKYYVNALAEEGNRAVGFYQRNGFESCASVVKYGLHYTVFQKNL